MLPFTVDERNDTEHSRHPLDGGRLGRAARTHGGGLRGSIALASAADAKFLGLKLLRGLFDVNDSQESQLGKALTGVRRS